MPAISKMPVPPMMSTEAWKAFDHILGTIADQHPRLAAKHGPTAGAAMLVAIQLLLVEKIEKEMGPYRASLEPVLVELRKCQQWADGSIRESSGDVH